MPFYKSATHGGENLLTKSGGDGTLPASRENQEGAAVSAEVFAALEAGKPYTLAQPEPMMTVRPRYEIMPVVDKARARGQRSTFRIIPNGGTRKSEALSTTNQRLNRIRDAIVKKDGDGFASFLLQSINVQFNEKSQIVHTMGDNEVVYYFGRTPTQASITGLIVDDADNRWFTDFVDMYNVYLRGTQMARNFELLEFSLPNSRITGTVLGMSYQQSSQRDTDVMFSMNILIKRYETIDALALFENRPATDISELEWVYPTRVKAFEENSKVNADLPAKYGQVFAPSQDKSKENRIYSYFGNLEKAPVGDKASSERITKESILDGINDFNKGMLELAAQGASVVDDALFLGDIREILNDTGDIFGAVTDVINSVELAANTLIDPFTRTLDTVQAFEKDFDRMVGSITALPSTLAESVSAAISGGKLNSLPLFLGGKSMTAEEALDTLKKTNKRDPSRTPRVGPASTASSADVVPTISF